MPQRHSNASLTHSWLLKHQCRTPKSLAGPRVLPKTGKRVKNKDRKTTLTITPGIYMEHWAYRMVHVGEMSKAEAKNFIEMT